MYSHPIPFTEKELAQVAGQTGTPTYCYDEATIRNRCRELKALFAGSDLPVGWLYAVKANDNPYILEIIDSEKFGFDTVSYGEVLLGRLFKKDPAAIVYTENNMTDEEMDLAIQSGVILNIGSISRLKAFCSHPNSRQCSIRIKPDISEGHHEKVDTGNRDSKFGIRIDRIPSCIDLARQNGVKITGIHMHIGSGIRMAENLIEAMRKLLEVANLLPDLGVINFGGGFPVAYREDDSSVFSLSQFAGMARDLLEADKKTRSRDVRYLFEPGRYVVAGSGVLLTRVNTVKEQENVTYLGTDTGFNHLLRPVLYNAYHEVINITGHDRKDRRTYTVSGNICESGDVLAENRLLPESKEGDLLVFADTGAYGITMASHYNCRALPAEVLKKEDGSLKVIRSRKSTKALVDGFLHETGWGNGEK